MARFLNQYNKYDKFLFILIISLIFGNFGNAFQIVRIMALLMAPSLFRKYPLCRYYSKNYVNVIRFFYCFAVLSLLWTGDKIEGLKALAYYPIHFLIFFEILIFSKFAKNPLKTISLSWLVVVSLSLPIALWEIMTDNHLALSKFDSNLSLSNGLTAVKVHFAAVTFGNYNGYVTFICFALPFLFYCLLTSEKMFYKSCCLVTIILCLVTILFNASRGGLLSFVVMTIVYYIMTPKNVIKIALLVLPVLYVIPFLIENGSAMFELIMMRAEDGGMLEDDVRSTIWGLSIKVLLNSFGIGAGVMGTRMAMEALKAPVTIPHNMVLEIMTDFGIVFGAIFVIYVIKLFFKARSHINTHIKVVLYMSILAMPFYLIIDSSYLLNAVYFAAFASITVFSYIDVIRSDRTLKRRPIDVRNCNLS